MKTLWTTINQEAAIYPLLLKQIHDPPEKLYIRGQLPQADAVMVAVVGSRKATTYGRQSVSKIVTPLAEKGIMIVSGLAYGIDAAAHEAALVGGGVTIGVLGTPIDQIYPPMHRQLADRMVAAGGAVISEIPPGGEIHRGTFPRRNRIIAGLASVTIVVEAALHSGSLITAGLALAENREVMAVPGPITSDMSQGTNNLLKLGARPVTSAEDVFELLGMPVDAAETRSTAVKKPTDPALAAIVEHVSAADPIHIDNLARLVTINLPTGQAGLPILQGQLTVLEIQGYIKMVQPGWYIRL